MGGGACDTKEERTDAAGVFAEGDFQRRVFVSAFFSPRVQRQLARRAVSLTEPEKAGSPRRSDRGAHSVIGSRAAFNVTRRL